MTIIGFVIHHARSEAAQLARRGVQQVVRMGHQALIVSTDANVFRNTVFYEGLRGASVPGEDLYEAVRSGGIRTVSEAELAEKCDVVVALGGDGTMLRAVHIVGAHHVPVMGVNVGHLGYLTEVEPSEFEWALEALSNGRLSIERRLMIEVCIERRDGSVQLLGPALNECVVRSTGAHVVELELAINGDLFTTYAADAMIVATPTGSTAYSLSARGPIMSPDLAALLITPVAPHQLFDRSLVLNPDDQVEMRIGGWRQANAIVDGAHSIAVRQGDIVRCRRSSAQARIVITKPRDFRRVLQSKFGLVDR